MQTTQKNNHLPLTPILHHWVQQLMASDRSLFAAVEKYGSPLNVHCLTPFEENIKHYQSILNKLGLKHKIFFARKANKCIDFPVAAARLGHGADTASYRELEQCLSNGLANKNLILTAAVKNRKLLELAVDNRVTVVLDNVDEFNLIKEIVEQRQTKVEINIRLGSFSFEGNTLPTRFGFTLEEAFILIQQIHDNEPFIAFKGLHFHLNGYSTEQRAAAIEQSIGLIDRLATSGIRTTSLDIGGGFLMNYLSSKTEWENFNAQLRLAILEERMPITYQNDPLGIVKVKGNLYGEPTVYPYYNELSKGKFLEAILHTDSIIYKQPIYKLLLQRDLELRMEPGRSLLDQCGVTVAKVAFRKKDTAGNWLFGLEMNRTQLRSSSADFLLDPIHIPYKKLEQDQELTEGYLVGAYCLEQELILKRKLVFSQFPQVGDLLVFPNTAGYMTHFFESEAHLFELAKNIMYEHEFAPLS